MNLKFDEMFDDYGELVSSKYEAWSVLRNMDGKGGVYIVYKDGNPIYVGSTKNFKVRFTDMLYGSTHTLFSKLIKTKDFKPHELRDFLKNKCLYKKKECDDVRKAEALEHLSIWILNPSLNK